MDSLKSKLESLPEKIKKYFVGTEEKISKSRILNKQKLNKALLLGGILLGIFLMILFLKQGDEDNLTQEEIFEDSSVIELGASSTKGQLKWQNFLEEEIEDEKNQRNKQISMLKKIVEDNAAYQNKTIIKEFAEMKARISFTLGELDRLKTENLNLKNDIETLSYEEKKLNPPHLSLSKITAMGDVNPPISTFNHIPATSYVSGNLLGGITVSTSVNSASEPIPVIIKITDRGSLPKNFAMDIKQCKILASCFGDISSERAIIRAEELVCEDKEASLSVSTKIAGLIYGDDGANGIRGNVVSMSDKHVRNAFTSSFLSAFAGLAKGERGFHIQSSGAIASKKRGAKALAGDGFFTGASNAAEKIADYHIKLAENISPVILVPGGTKVDVVFTKSVQLGSFEAIDSKSFKRVNHAS